MLIVQDRKVVTFFYHNFSSRSDDVFFLLLLLLLLFLFSSLVSARILWSIFIKFQNCICYLFLMIVSHTVVFNISSHSFLGIFEMLISPYLLLLMICLKIGFSFSSHTWVGLSFSTISTIQTVHFCGVKVTQPPVTGGRLGFDSPQKLSGKPLIQTHKHACLHTHTNN